MADPTRPPAEFLRGSSAERDASALEPLRLQSVKIGKGGNFAVIDGVLVKEGDTFNQMKVVRIHHQGVELRGELGPMSLSLNPSVTKTNRKSSLRTTNDDSMRRIP